MMLALILLWARDNPSNSIAAFRRAHQIFEDTVVRQAWDAADSIDLHVLLPSCEPKIVSYCEGRHWITTEDKEAGYEIAVRAFCPRTKNSCEPSFIPIYEDVRLSCSNYGARLYAECSHSWKDWSILELLSSSNITPSLVGLRNPEEYVSKLAGWVNRLNEIRKRLRCSTCGEIMRPNVSYAKLLAKFSVTILSCGNGINHDQDVYLNECWGCNAIIDSRENQQRVEKYYLCLQCGSGPQNNSKYSQGTICPKCGATPMHQINNRDYNCLTCNHKIRVPEEWHLTGRDKAE